MHFELHIEVERGNPKRAGLKTGWLRRMLRRGDALNGHVSARKTSSLVYVEVSGTAADLSAIAVLVAGVQKRFGERGKVTLRTAEGDTFRFSDAVQI